MTAEGLPSTLLHAPWWWSFGQRLQAFLVLLVPTASSYYIYQSLAKLSTPALWLPTSLRTSGAYLVTTLGMAVFSVTLWIFRIPNEQTHSANPVTFVNRSAALIKVRVWGLVVIASALWFGRSTLRNQSMRPAERKSLNLVGATVFAVLAALFLGGFILLQSYYVQEWDSRDWTTNNQIQDALAADRVRAASTSATQPVRSPVTTASDENTDLPDFVDAREGKLLLPIWYPPDLKRYLSQLHQQSGDGGLQYMLDNEPDHLFDWLKQASFAIGLTRMLFLLFDVLIVAFAAIAMALGDDANSNIFNLLVTGVLGLNSVVHRQWIAACVCGVCFLLVAIAIMAHPKPLSQSGQEQGSLP